MSDKFEVKEVRGKGLGCFALKDIKRGELIFKEDPIMSFKEFNDIEEVFRPMKIVEAFGKLPESSKEQYLKLDETYINLESPEEMSRDHPMYLILKEVMKNRLDDNPMAKKIYRIFMANHYALEIFAQASRLNHCCKGNAGFRDFVVNEIVATKKIKKDEEITINYVGPILNMKPKSFRQSYLLQHRGFQCLCESCLNERKDAPEYHEYKELKAQLRSRKGQKRCSAEQCIEQIEILKRMYKLAKEMKTSGEEFILITARGLCFAVIGFKNAKSDKEKAKMETCEEEVKRFARTMARLPDIQRQPVMAAMLNTLANHPGQAIKEFKFLLEIFEEFDKQWESLPFPREE